jgi:hypothetical protein
MNVSYFETSLDTIDAHLNPVQPAIDASQPLLNRCDANLQILKVIGHAFGSLIDLA